MGGPNCAARSSMPSPVIAEEGSVTDQTYNVQRRFDEIGQNFPKVG
jgi:hypothetical protein